MSEAERGYILRSTLTALKISLTNGSDLLINGSAIINCADETLRIIGIDNDNTFDTSSEQLELILPPMRKIIKNTTVMALSLYKLHLEATETMNKVIATLVV